MKLKNEHEIRDPIHVFIHMNSDERRILDSPPVQRLRYIHQLALTSYVYPGAAHTRFEHSIGTMEVATRIYDIVTDDRHNKYCDLTIDKSFNRQYWRRVIRLAALLHDIGHSPFSHAPEGLFPKGWNHERMTREIITSGYLDSLCRDLKIQADDVALLAVGPEKSDKKVVKNLEAILSEIIIGDSFGADRIDYLLRDSYHSGVAYGKFDHYRLIETLRILPKSYEDSEEPALGIEVGGLQSAEALLLARYFMFSQLYFHPIRRIYDIHLLDFLRVFLKGGTFPTDVEEYLKITDNEIMTGIYSAYRDSKNPAHEYAKRIVERKHFKVLYSRNPLDFFRTTGAGKAIFEAACDKFGEDKIRYDPYVQKGSDVTFPVLEKDERIVSSRMKSEVLNTLPVVKIDTVYVEPGLEETAKRWLEKEREGIIASKEMRK
jgi:HD superfamily phosphohydrolases